MRDFHQNKDDNNLLDYIWDKASQCDQKNIPTHTNFLDLRQQSLVASIQKQFSVKHQFWGGYEDAERKLLVFLPEYLDFPEDSDLCLLEVSHHHPSPLTHRDYLGSVLALGIRRDKLGDILVFEQGCQIILLKELADFLLANYHQAGRTPLETQVKPLSEIILPQQKTKLLTDTVASLRLDAVASSAFGISRALAVKYIESGKAFVNNQEVCKPDKLLSPTDKITIRGYGKAVLKSISGTSKKGRLFIQLEVYL